MNAKSDKTSALVPRPPSAVEKAELGAKRVLAVMVSDTLAIAQKQTTVVSTTPAKAELEKWFHEGCKHYSGDGVPRNYAEAAHWWRKAAEEGHAAAQNNLGLCYQGGDGVPQNCTEGAKWYRKAAEQGHAVAQNNLGCCYRGGHGVPQDCTEAVKWFRKAAEQGYVVAQSNLGDCYANGHGVKADLDEGHKWWRLAEAQGGRWGKGFGGVVFQVGGFLSPEEFGYAESERLYEEIMATHRRR